MQSCPFSSWPCLEYPGKPGMRFLARLHELGTLETEIQVSRIMGLICKYCVLVANKASFKSNGLWFLLAVKMLGYETRSFYAASPLPLSLVVLFPCSSPCAPTPPQPPPSSGQLVIHHALQCCWGKEGARRSCKDAQAPDTSHTSLLQLLLPAPPWSSGSFPLHSLCLKQAKYLLAPFSLALSMWWLAA